MRALNIYCESFGCQMNAYDSERIVSLLEKRGHAVVGSPEAADCIVVNTCSVREHAEQRALGRLRDLAPRGDQGIGRLGIPGKAPDPDAGCDSGDSGGSDRGDSRTNPFGDLPGAFLIRSREQQSELVATVAETEVALADR